MLGLPAVEIAVKGVLLANIKNILSCAIDPFISDEILRNGIVFNLQQIDITDTLRYSPLDEIGKYYYFDNTWNITRSDNRHRDALMTLSFQKNIRYLVQRQLMQLVIINIKFRFI